MKVLPFIFLLLSSAASFGQERFAPVDLLAQVAKTQRKFKIVEYTVLRHDTLVTGDIRSIRGSIIMETDETDTLTGFKFWAKQDDQPQERLYNGTILYNIDPTERSYTTSAGAEKENMFLGGGGRLVIPELVKIDTTHNSGIELVETQNCYTIIIHYNDLKAYDVTQRRKIVTIDKKNMLPVAVRHHQETYGKVQDLYFEITGLKIDSTPAYNFIEPPFLKDYRYIPPPSAKYTDLLQTGTQAPAFHLKSFDGKIINLDDLKGKVVLLDFWEVWCGPCVESMPKIIALHDKYRGKGLVVLGITNDLGQVPSARTFTEKKGINFPMLIGNAQLKADYRLEGVPMYVLIDGKGIIRFVSLGFTPELEGMLAKLIN